MRAKIHPWEQPRKSSRIAITRYGSRNWAVYEDGELLCVTVYKKGAVEVAERIGYLKELAEAPPLPFATPEAPDTPHKFRSARKGTDEAKEIHQKL